MNVLTCIFSSHTIVLNVLDILVPSAWQCFQLLNHSRGCKLFTVKNNMHLYLPSFPLSQKTNTQDNKRERSSVFKLDGMSSTNGGKGCWLQVCTRSRAEVSKAAQPEKCFT